ncbi:class I SAM-dependent methyltransferase [Candidatus Woesearchaeota archaeon]|nr:class I SAM-dependent methyltransferase [Candidatus Woesearchaeota archaeon]
MTTKNYYSTIAESYNELHKEEQLKKFRLIKGIIKAKPLMLDVGCGTGLVKKIFKTKIVSLDPSFVMLKKFSGLRVCGEAEHLPFKNKVFNTIICVTAAHHFNPLELFVKDVKRVAKKNAGIAVTILKKSKDFKKIKKILK